MWLVNLLMLYLIAFYELNSNIHKLPLSFIRS